jgi:hypothetical protein
MISQRGVRHLFRAWPVAIGRGIPSAAVTLTVFDVVAEWLVQEGIGRRPSLPRQKKKKAEEESI